MVRMMKGISETEALKRLRKLKQEYASRIQNEFETGAKACALCATPGECCLDDHFVNVHITRLEAAAIREKLAGFADEFRKKIDKRIDETIEKYGLSEVGETSAKTYRCPLYEKGIGCLVHGDAKPTACISHACYEKKEDLPPDEIQSEMEDLVESLNRRTYGERTQWLPLPRAIQELPRR
ncbi:MAG TPA: hypothetical protein DEA22_04005 [Blastocatellia bacterium]|nr:hypothetical protein [Blastocatellia bacterium]